MTLQDRYGYSQRVVSWVWAEQLCRMGQSENIMSVSGLLQLGLSDSCRALVYTCIYGMKEVVFPLLNRQHAVAVMAISPDALSFVCRPWKD